MEKDDNNGWGGAREGAGRKPGANKFREALEAAFTEDRLEEMIRQTLEHVQKGDKEMLKYLWDQLAGKAAQTTRIEGDGANPLTMVIERLANGNEDDTTSS